MSDDLYPLANTDFAEAAELRARLHEVVEPDRIVTLADALVVAGPDDRDACHKVHVDVGHAAELLEAATELAPFAITDHMAYRWLVTDLRNLVGAPA